MASTAKILSTHLAAQAEEVPEVPAPAPRPPRLRLGALLALVREAFGGALLLGAWLALWTVTWAAVAGPLAPVPHGRAGAAVERVNER